MLIQGILSYTPYVPPVPTGANYGFLAGGHDIDYVMEPGVFKLDYSTGILGASTVASLTEGKAYHESLSDKSLYGYYLGGLIADFTCLVGTDRITFSTNVTEASTASNLSTASSNGASVSDGSLYGYTSLGSDESVNLLVDVDRITFSTGANAANSTSYLSEARNGTCAISDASLYGYISGGDTSGVSLSKTDKITFSTGVASTNTTNNLAIATYTAGGISDNSTYGYVISGVYYPPEIPSDGGIQRITFSTGVFDESLTSVMAVPARLMGSSSDGATSGYLFGGLEFSENLPTNTITILTFSTGALAVSTVSTYGSSLGGIAGLSDFAV